MNAAQHREITSHDEDDIKLTAWLLITGIKTEAIRAQVRVVQKLTIIVNEP
jgi:hypothetical protein